MYKLLIEIIGILLIRVMFTPYFAVLLFID